VFERDPGPVKSFRPNPWGLFDLLGNRWEMCWDGYARRSHGLILNPTEEMGNFYANRGGAAAAGLFYLEASFRIALGEEANSGFRVVCGPLQSTEMNESDEALAILNRAVERDPGSLRALRVRAQLRMRRGEWDEAAADLRRCLSADREGVPWAHSGWWVVGPYPEALRRACPPEVDPDPFKPVAAGPRVRGITGPWPKERQWEPAEVDVRNCLDLGEIFDGAEHISAYALMRVYCLEKQRAVIRVGSDDMVRVWLNGRQVHQHLRIREAAPDQDAVPVVLEAGWNTVLVKVVNVEGAHALFLRLTLPNR
jgi:hypothetical protein